MSLVPGQDGPLPPWPGLDPASVNRANWDERAPAHAASSDYGVDRYVTDPEHLSDVVRFDQPWLGDLRGLRGAHLQCHIGTDTLSLARLGARMSGLDFSPVAIEHARRLAAATGAEVDFVVADVHDAVEVLGARAFDLVYTGIGALCWLPGVRRWAGVVAGLLRPGGRLVVRDAHPMLQSLGDPRPDGLVTVELPYVETVEPRVWDEPGTYVETDAVFEHTVTAEWSHGLGELVTALLDAGLELRALAEHDSVPWDARPGEMVADERGEWRLADRPERLAASFTVVAQKR